MLLFIRLKVFSRKSDEHSSAYNFLANKSMYQRKHYHLQQREPSQILRMNTITNSIAAKGTFCKKKLKSLSIIPTYLA